jgi:hypothetical protein
MPSMSTLASAQPAKPEPPRTAWEKVVTSTPVILTVVATILAGLSSSEMTRAQYYRSLAAQHQAKVSDQWNFFQAKRIRGTSMDLTIKLLGSLSAPGEVKPPGLQTAAERLPDDFRRAEEEAKRLVQAVGAAKGQLGPDGERLAQAAGKLQTAARQAAEAANGVRQDMARILGKGEVQQSFRYLNTASLPGKEGQSAEERQLTEAALKNVDPKVRATLNYIEPEMLKAFYDINPALLQALADIAGRQTEHQMAGTLAAISPEQVEAAIDAAETIAAEFDAVGKPTGKTYRDLGDLLTRQAALVHAFDRAARDVSIAVGVLPAGEGEGLTRVRQAAAAVARTNADLKTASEELVNDFKAAQLDYTFRRYDREARYNQAIAGLYEIEVRKASLQADRHVTRSHNFFYAMLAAQAGVTIATFSLAVRQKSLFWGLATMAGLTALSFAGYVYLKM